MSRYSKIARKPVPQSEPLDDRQVANNAGGFVYQLDDWKRLDRFLILGSDAPTYYQQAKALTKENGACVTRCYDLDPDRTVHRIVEISDSGRAPKNDSAIFALALGTIHKDVKARQMAFGAVPYVCRTSTHLFQFLDNCKALGKGWGRGLHMAVAKWYDEKGVDQVAFQAIKYRQREGFTHKRTLEASHARSTGERKSLYLWMKGKDIPSIKLPPIVRAHLDVMRDDISESEMLAQIRAHRLPWEALPTAANTNPKVWEAMLPTLGLTAMIRNLGNMSRIGAIKPLSDTEALIVDRLSDEKNLKASRVHPFSILLANAVYGSGKGVRGSGEWRASQPIMSALDAAFYKTFANVVPANKRFLIGLDVSGSMSSPFMSSPLMCSEATAALSLVTMATEPRTHVFGFADGFRELGLRKGMTLEGAVKKVSNLTFGGTDCALPMLYAMKEDIEVDVFLVMTDNETWAGGIHPAAALAQYRKKTGINAKLIVVGMTSTGFTIADPNDDGMLDVVGFDANCPALMADFARDGQ